MVDVMYFAALGLRSHARWAAESLFLRNQLALNLERETKPRRATNAARLILIMLASSSRADDEADDLTEPERRALHDAWLAWKAAKTGR